MVKLLSRKLGLVLGAGVVLVLRPTLAWPVVVAYGLYMVGNVAEHWITRK